MCYSYVIEIIAYFKKDFVYLNVACLDIKTKVAQNHMVIPLSERSYFRIKCGSNKVISTSSNIKKVKYTAVVTKSPS